MINRRRCRNQYPGMAKVILKADQVFSAQYRLTKDPYILIAQQRFCERVKQQRIPSSVALQKLEDEDVIANLLTVAKYEYEEQIEKRVKERENKIMQIVLKNTNFKAVLLMGLVVAACSQPMSTLYNRAYDALFGKAEDDKKATAPHCPCESANGRPRYFLEPEKGLPVRRVWDHAAASDPVRICGS